MKVSRLWRAFSPSAGSDVRAFARWFFLCALVGVGGGLTAAALSWAVEWLQFVTLVRPFGVHLEPMVTEESIHPVGSSGAYWWLLPVVPAVGGLLVGLLARMFGPEVFSGGTDRMLDSYHRRFGEIRWTVPLAKWLASAITLGTGGSAGREGPMSLIAGGVGSVIGALFRVGPRERRLLLLAGAGAGIGAVFRVPFGSAIFAIEVLYRDGFEEESIFPCLIASVFGYSTFVAFHGTGSLFVTPEFPPLALSSVPLFGLVGLAVVPFGYLFTGSLRVLPALLQRVGIPRWFQPCVGGLAVGLLGVLHSDLLGIGYGWVQQVLSPGSIIEASLAVAGSFLLFALGKIVATALTVGSGGSGGTFAPSVVSGAFVGGAVGYVLKTIMPTYVTEPAAYALAGMAAFLGGVAHVPLAAVVMVSELVGNYDLLVPLMLAVGVSYLLLRRTTLYPAQVRNPAASPVHAGGFVADALQTLRVGDVGALRPAPSAVPATMPMSKLVSLFAERRFSVVPMHDGDGRVRLVITLQTIRTVMDNAEIWPHLIAADAARPLIRVGPEDSLHRVMEILVKMDNDELLVSDPRGEVLGVIGHDDVARLALREALRKEPKDGSDQGVE